MSGAISNHTCSLYYSFKWDTQAATDFHRGDNEALFKGSKQ